MSAPVWLTARTYEQMQRDIKWPSITGGRGVRAVRLPGGGVRLDLETPPGPPLTVGTDTPLGSSGLEQAGPGAGGDDLGGADAWTNGPTPPAWWESDPDWYDYYAEYYGA